jgi:hypothetical protein
MRRAFFTWLARTALVLGTLWAAGSPVHAVPPRVDPAHVEGRWNYRTRSNCGSVEGVGQVTFRWDAGRRMYEERGSVFWSDSGTTIRWWGFTRYLPSKRRLEGQMHNSLDDDVDGRWALQGEGPARLVVRWSQTNGCTGTGVATRARP